MSRLRRNSTAAEAVASPVNVSRPSLNQGLNRSCCRPCESSRASMTACVWIGLVAKYPARRYSDERPTTTNNFGPRSLARQADAAANTRIAGKENARQKTAVVTISTLTPISIVPRSWVIRVHAAREQSFAIVRSWSRASCDCTVDADHRVLTSSSTRRRIATSDCSSHRMHCSVLPSIPAFAASIAATGT